MKNILLKLNEEMFYKLAADKVIKEGKLKEKLTWEAYVMDLFGFKKLDD